MKKNYPYLSAIILMIVAINNYSHAQTTDTISTSTGFYDATVYKDLRPGYSYLMDANYEDFSTLSAMAWTHSGANTFRRTFLYFDLSKIPVGVTINSAKLYLYSDPTVTSPSAGNGNSVERI